MSIPTETGSAIADRLRALVGRDLDWKMRHTVDEMVSSAWHARKAATA